ncbi:MAG: tol-pal system protein YbgF [Betaproteobacteria bacterium]|nr:tol-pal system protein YbgF [Betaproteobacteria bacterium]
MMSFGHDAPGNALSSPNGRDAFPQLAAALLAVFGLALLPVPSSAALFGDDEARNAIAAERKRVDQVSAQVAAQSQQLDTINARLGKLEEATGKNQAVLDLFREIEGLKQELARMRGQMEVLNNGVEQAQKRQQDFYVDLDTRLRRLESASAPPPMGGVPSGSGDVVASGKPGAQPAAGASGSAETRAYEAAQNLRRIGNYQGAIVAFQNFLKQYRKSPLAPSAQYWIGDSYFNMRDFRLAISSQRLLVASYPESSKVPDALLNIASSQAELGETAAARKTMDELVAKHPGSDAAEKARRRMANVR